MAGLSTSSHHWRKPVGVVDRGVRGSALSWPWSGASDQAGGGCTTDRMFPSGSLNQAPLIPPSSAMPLTVFSPGRSYSSKR
jgi:hypothetical protein